MVADGGTVKAKLILDTGEFTAGWKKALGDLNQKVNGPDLSGVKKDLADAGKAGQKAKADIEQINNSRFDKLSSSLDAVMKKMQNSTSSGVRTIGNTISSGISAVDFGGLHSRFAATINKMHSTAASGVKSIVGEFSSMEASLGDIFATVAGGAGLREIFMYGMGRATTQAMLSNSETPQDAETIMGQYKQYTVASSTPDTDIQRVLKYVIQGAPPSQTYRSLSAIDAAAFTPDPVQRQELLRNYGQYLTSGYSAALFRGDVTPEEAQILEAAKTPEERIAAMETIAKNKGSMTETGENLSTLTTGPMANYNKALIITDTLMRGMTDGFNKFMDAISPIMDWFIALDPETQNFIGNLIFFAGILGMAGGAVKVLGSLFSPFIGIFKAIGSGAIQVAQKLSQMIPTDKISTVLGKLKDLASNGISSMSDKVGELFSGLKDKISGPLTSFKDAVIGKFNDLKDWIESKWSPRPSSPTPVGGTTGQQGGFFGVPAATIAGGLGSIMVVGGAAVAGGYGLKQINDLLGGDHNQLMSSIGLQGPLGTGPGAFAGAMIGGEKMSFLDFLRAGVPGIGVMGTSYDTIKKLLPGTSSAAGKDGKKSIGDDIFGEKGILRGTPLAGLKWPTPQQILEKIKNVLVPKVPNFNWKVPNVGQILKGIWDKINPLNWKIPGVNQILGQTWDKIKELWWSIPNPGQFLSQTWEKIKELWWDIPTAGQILDYIKAIIPPFSWPWGPGGGTRAVNVAADVGSRARALLASGPRGPLTNMVSGEISRMSGLGQGNIASAMGKRFQGVSAFTDIANGMADHLSYEFYMNGQKSNREVWDSGTCNCFDGAEFLLTEANRKMGLGGGLTNGLWNGTAIPHTWATIGGQPFDMAAMLLRGQWNPPSGPGAKDFAQFMTDIGPGLEYLGYPGHGKDPMAALDSGGNCFDMTLGLMQIASGLFGLPSEMVWGTWGGNSHVWLKAGNKEYDPSMRALSSSYNPPPSGPGDSSSGGVHFHEGAIQIQGSFIGMEDYKEQMKEVAKSTMEEAVKRKNRTRFGG